MTASITEAGQKLKEALENSVVPQNNKILKGKSKKGRIFNSTLHFAQTLLRRYGNALKR